MGRPIRHQGVTIDKLRWAHAAIAKLVLTEPMALPIFERLDHELRAAEAIAADDPIAAARAMLSAQNAIR